MWVHNQRNRIGEKLCFCNYGSSNSGIPQKTLISPEGWFKKRHDKFMSIFYYTIIGPNYSNSHFPLFLGVFYSIVTYPKTLSLIKVKTAQVAHRLILWVLDGIVVSNLGRTNLETNFSCLDIVWVLWIVPTGNIPILKPGNQCDS